MSRKVSIQQQQQLNRKEKKAIIDFGDKMVVRKFNDAVIVLDNHLYYLVCCVESLHSSPLVLFCGKLDF